MTRIPLVDSFRRTTLIILLLSGVTATTIVSHQKPRIGYKINGLSPVKYRIQSTFSFIYNYKIVLTFFNPTIAPQEQQF